MEFYAELFQPILPFLKENAVLLIVVALLLGVIFYFTRRYSVPALVFLLQIVVLSYVMHVFIFVLVKVSAWFKSTSSMRIIHDETDHVYWTTPLLRFWEWEEYDPNWIIWLELVLFIVILVLVHRLRPLKPQYKHKSRFYQEQPKTKSTVDDDDWGVPRKYTGLNSSAKDLFKR